MNLFKLVWLLKLLHWLNNYLIDLMKTFKNTLMLFLFLILTSNSLANILMHEALPPLPLLLLSSRTPSLAFLLNVHSPLFQKKSTPPRLPPIHLLISGLTSAKSTVVTSPFSCRDSHGQRIHCAGPHWSYGWEWQRPRVRQALWAQSVWERPPGQGESGSGGGWGSTCRDQTKGAAPPVTVSWHFMSLM